MRSAPVPVLLHYRGRSSASLDRVPIQTIDGDVVAEMHLAPPILVSRALDRLTATPDLPDAELLERVADASRMFGGERLDGLTPDQYCSLLAAVAGNPAHNGESALAAIGSYGGALPRALRAQRPELVEHAVTFDEVAGELRWVPRGRTISVVAPGNHPETYQMTLYLLACGYRIALRPSHHDPFTGRRLVAALVQAGLADRIAFLPTGHDGVDQLVRGTDLSVCFGGPDIEARYASNPRVSVHGPGRSKAVVGQQITTATVDHLVTAIAGAGGVRCMNISAVYTASDPVRLAEELAARLADIPTMHPTDLNAVLPGVPLARAEDTDRQIRRLGLRDHSDSRYGGETVVRVGPGSAVLRPRVLSAPVPWHPAIGTEYGFPFVIVAPWPSQAPVSARIRLLRNTMVAALLDDDEELRTAALQEPTIRKVIAGPALPWWTNPSLPHDGLMTHFLFEGKTLITYRRTTPAA